MKSTYVYEHWCQAIPREARRRLLLGVPGSGRLAFRHDEFVMKEFNAKLKSVMRVRTDMSIGAKQYHEKRGVAYTSRPVIS